MHILLAVKLVKKECRRAIQRYESFVTLSDKPSMEWRDLWMIFKPGDLAFYDAYRNTKAILKIVKVRLHVSCDRSYWAVTAKTFAHNGNNFGYHHRVFQIDRFEGTQEINKLMVFPLKYYSGVDELRQELILRGKKFCSLVGVQYHAYVGKAWAVEHERVSTSWGGVKDEYPEEAFQLTGRIMLDCASFVERRTDANTKLTDIKKVSVEQITDDDLLITHFKMPGFSLSEKRWCWFLVDQIEEVEFDDDAFDALLLPAGQKRLVRALTKQHTLHDSPANSFDDFIKNKGKGCIFLFHGEPGVGKTFTVESIADSIRRPLYVMMSGDLGVDINAIEKNLVRILKLVTKWKAILLLDEADVFLEARSSHDLQRNALVSIFLRVLEYFQGIMFLTTNMVTALDLAFQSRIHLALKYPPLDMNQRVELWRMFLKRTPNYNPEKWPEAVLREFAELKLNGRQVKNVVRTANSLALSEDNELSVEDIQIVLDTVVKFASDFGEQIKHDRDLSSGWTAHSESIAEDLEFGSGFQEYR